MLSTQTLNYLEILNDVEIEQKKTGKLIIDFPQAAYNNDEFLHFSDMYLFQKSNIHISKHNRFADFPKHSHDFVEINYVVRGKSVQWVNDEKIILHENDLLLMNTGCTHSLQKLKQEDIVVNFAFSFHDLDLLWLEELDNSHTYFLNFIFQDINKSNKQFLHFKGSSNPNLQYILDSLIDTYFTNPLFSKSIIYRYFEILLMELLSNTEILNGGTVAIDESEKVLFNLFLDINKNYRTVSLNQLSRKYGYHKNYLSKLIKKLSHHTFSEIITKKRMERAAFLLTHTFLSIQDIINDINLENKGYFYLQFKKHYGMTPLEFRNKTHE